MAGGQVIRGDLPPATPPAEGPKQDSPLIQGEKTEQASPSSVPDEYIGDDAPAEFNPALRILKSIFWPVGRFFRGIGAFLGIVKTPQAEPQQPLLPMFAHSTRAAFTIPLQSGAEMIMQPQNDNAVIFRSQNPFDLANLFEIIESDGRQTHKPLSQIVDAMTTFPLQGFTVAGMFSVMPSYDSFTHSYDVRVRPIDDSVSIDRIYASLGQFERQAERDIVERVDAVSGSDPSIGDVLRTLTDIFNSEFYRYANRLSVDKDSGDPRLRGMLNVESMISESVPSNISLEGSVRVLEVGVRENSEGEVTAFIFRFVKGDDFQDNEINFKDVVTWIGKIDQSTGKITWYYHEVVNDPAHVSTPASPAFLTTRDILKKLIPQANWDVIKYGVEFGARGGNQSGPSPGSPVTPATPTAGPQAAPAASGQGASASVSTTAPGDEDAEITAAPDEYFEVEYTGYPQDEDLFAIYEDPYADVDDSAGDAWVLGVETSIVTEGFAVP